MTLYWLMTFETALRFIFQVSANIIISEKLKTLIALSSILHVVAIILFFYSMRGRIRPVGSQYREAKGEKFLTDLQLL